MYYGCKIDGINERRNDYIKETHRQGKHKKMEQEMHVK